MFTRRILPAFLALLFVQAGFAQTPEKEKPKTGGEDLRKDAVELLRETSAEVGNLRSLENRIGFSSEMAGLMWFYDAKEAAAMFQAVITDFKQLFADYDARMNAVALKPDDYDFRSNGFMGGDDDKTRFMRKLTKAMGIRQQVALSLAEHDAALAFDFYSETANIITNPEIRAKLEERDAYFETQFVKTLADKDAAKAVALARKSLARGVNWTQIELLQKIYDKDNAKGAEFADDIVKKLKDDKVSASNLYNVGSFLGLGAENSEKIKKEAGKKPMFSDRNLRDLANLLAQSILELKSSDESAYLTTLTANIELIEKYAPARGVQIRAKFPALAKKQTPSSYAAATPTTIVEAKEVQTAATAEAEAENSARKEQEETMKNVMKLSEKELPKEERDKIVANARKIINGMGSRREKIMALSLLASQVAGAGDRELAAELMKDAQALVNPQPKNYQDFLEVWFLASALSGTDAEKAFPLLEDTVMRLNDTLAAFIKVGEFIDVSGEIIDDGEVQIGAFGGRMMNDLTRELGAANVAIRNLAAADFGKTKALTNKFERTEVRILAKMLVLRAVLGGDKKPVLAGDGAATEGF